MHHTIVGKSDKVIQISQKNIGQNIGQRVLGYMLRLSSADAAEVLEHLEYIEMGGVKPPTSAKMEKVIAALYDFNGADAEHQDLVTSILEWRQECDRIETSRCSSCGRASHS